MKKKITLLGRSQKFERIFRDTFPNSKIKIIPWRECGRNIVKRNASIDLLVICGYDYRSSWYPFSKYIKKNIYNPLGCVKKIAGPNTTILYIDTKDESKNFTYSRYRYAKNQFGKLLMQEFGNVKKISPPVIMNENNKIDIHSDFFTKTILTILFKMKIIESISHQDLLALIKKTMDQNYSNRFRYIKPKFLKIIRPHIIDRLMRLIFG